MANISFSNNPNAEQATAEVVTPAPVETPAPQCSVPATMPRARGLSSIMPGSDTLPEFTDIKFPRLNIVQKVGELSNVHPHGAILFAGTQLIYQGPVKNGDKVILEGTPPAEILVLGMGNKQFVEKIAWGSDERALTLPSEEAVIRNGGTTSYQEWELKKKDGMRLFQPMVNALVGIRKPEHVADPNGINFVFDVDGQKWALALWSLTRSAFNAGAKTLYTARMTGCLRQGYPTFTWNLSTLLKSHGGNFYFVPVLTPREPASEALKAFAAQALCPITDSASGAEAEA